MREFSGNEVDFPTGSIVEATLINSDQLGDHLQFQDGSVIVVPRDTTWIVGNLSLVVCGAEVVLTDASQSEINSLVAFRRSQLIETARAYSDNS